MSLSAGRNGPIAILGATSHLARDFVLTAQATFAPELRLYARRPQAVTTFLARHGLEERFPVRSLDQFGREPYAAIINFIGVGDPARARAMGAEIFSATLLPDQMVLGYLADNPETTYIFMSSGAVYGTSYTTPVTAESRAEVPINNLQPQNYYSVAKLYAEAVHRSHDRLNIFDIRIFNYISRTVDLGARFLITDMINAIRAGTVFTTDSRPVLRDFLHPEDFCRLVRACLSAPAGANMPLDAYSQSMIAKDELLALLTEEFGLRYEIVPAVETVNATGAKPHYYSANKRAATLGYEPAYSSRSAIVKEIRAILAA